MRAIIAVTLSLLPFIVHSDVWVEKYESSDSWVYADFRQVSPPGYTGFFYSDDGAPSTLVRFSNNPIAQHNDEEVYHQAKYLSGGDLTEKLHGYASWFMQSSQVQNKYLHKAFGWAYMHVCSTSGNWTNFGCVTYKVHHYEQILTGSPSFDPNVCSLNGHGDDPGNFRQVKVGSNYTHEIKVELKCSHDYARPGLSITARVTGPDADKFTIEEASWGGGTQPYGSIWTTYRPTTARADHAELIVTVEHK